MASNEWTINYLPDEGGRLTGKLKLTDESVIFNALYDSSNKEIVKGISGSLAAFAASGGHAIYLHDTDTDYTITLPRDHIKHAELVKKGLMKRAVIHMEDGSSFVFDYGMLNPKNLVNAVNG